MTIAVIGRGLIGSAAAKYLAGAGREVILIGPDEPSDRAAHEGVFGSHYDEGRITRSMDADPYWSAASGASIARYRKIESASGAAFFTECGSVMAGYDSHPAMQALARCVTAAGIAAERLDRDGLHKRFPYFGFGADDFGYHERAGAGHVSPRNLVRAQTVLAEQAGARILRTEALSLRPDGGGAVVETGEGPVAVDEVLVAAGAFSNALLPDPLPLTVYARTVAFFRIGKAEAARLAGMPSLIHFGRDGSEPYLLPPIRYPDGALYLKLGGDPVDLTLADAAEARDWFRGAGRAEVGRYLRNNILTLMPGLDIEEMHTEACATTFTSSDRPEIGRLSPWLSVAVGGCGRAAKCSDELGRRAAGIYLS